jgi:putative ABC transport system permease protein
MHGTLSTPRRKPVSGVFFLMIRLVLRELRGGVKGFWVFLACLILGVMAIAGVASVSRALNQGLEQEGQRILGGDLAFTLLQREANAQEAAFLNQQGSLSRLANLRGMAIAENGDSALVEVKAVDSSYPAIGDLSLQPALSVANALKLQNGVYGAAADPVLLARLDLKAGDHIRLGSSVLELRSVIVSEPDKIASGVGFGPRLIIHEDALRLTQLIQPGSLIRWTYRIVMPQDRNSDADLNKIIENAKRILPESGGEIRSRKNADPRFSRNIERFTQFLTLVALTTLLVGGVGVAGAAKGFVDRKRASIAVLKSLGATGGFVVMLYLLQSLVIGVLGIGMGLVLGAALPFAVAAAFNTILPLPLTPIIAPYELMVAAGYGVLTILVFALIPLGRAHDVSVSQLFRDLIAPVRAWPRRIYVLCTGICVVLLLGLAIGTAYDPRIAFYFILGSGGAFILLRLVAYGVIFLARHMPRPSLPAARLALGNLHRPGALTPSLILSLGLGVTLLVSLALIDSNLRRQLTQSLPDKAPSFFFIDISSSQQDAFASFLHDQVQGAKIDQVPMMRGRLVALNDIPAEQIKARDDAAWVLDGDRGITFSQTFPEGSRLEEGAWWSSNDQGPPLVSFDAEIAKGLGLKLGDRITVNVLGRKIEATIANLRRVEWRSLGINFVMVFSPNTFKGAPHSLLATVTPQKALSFEQESSLMRASAQKFPTITAIRVREALETMNQVVGQLVSAIRGASLIAFVASVLVLAGALSASRQARTYDTVLFKTLGGSRARLLGAYALEYGLLGFIASLFGVMAGSLAAFLIVTRIMNLDFAFALSGPLLAAGFATGLTLISGLLGTLRLLSQKPAPYLRNL